ncbi:sugar transferase [Nocardia gipuzkoensis]|jgi:lipopolysaccharide/colanic/teichoic acid biosynthesis glycosyltransferase
MTSDLSGHETPDPSTGSQDHQKETAVIKPAGTGNARATIVESLALIADLRNPVARQQFVALLPLALRQRIVLSGSPGLDFNALVDVCIVFGAEGREALLCALENSMSVEDPAVVRALSAIHSAWAEATADSSRQDIEATNSAVERSERVLAAVVGVPADEEMTGADTSAQSVTVTRSTTHVAAARVSRGLLLLIVLALPLFAILLFPVLKIENVRQLGFAGGGYFAYIVIVTFAADIGNVIASRWSHRIADMVDAWVQRRLTRYGRYYLRTVVSENRYVELQGVSTRGPHVLEMADVFVRLTLSGGPTNKLSPNPLSYGSTAANDSFDIWHWVSRTTSVGGSALALIGPPGSGKTTLLRHVAFIVALGGKKAGRLGAPSKIPVIAYLRKNQGWKTAAPADLIELIQWSLPDINGRSAPRSWIKENILRGNFLILIDGLDEISDPDNRRRITSWIEDQSNRQSGSIFVLTSRPFGYRDNPVQTAVTLQVQPFNDEQIENFVQRWTMATSLRAHGERNESSISSARSGAAVLLTKIYQVPALQKLASNPLLLNMIANVQYYRGDLPQSRPELYRDICDVFLGKRHEARGLTYPVSVAQKKMVLQELAHRMMEKKVLHISSQEAERLIEKPLERIPRPISSADFLRHIEDVSGLLIEREYGSLAFAHATFQNFLAAEFIKEHSRGPDLAHVVGDDWWRETILFYIAGSDATPIVAACLAYAQTEPADKSTASTLTLAIQCADEARELSAELQDAVHAMQSPPDIMTNHKARQIAARTKLLQRANREQRILPGIYATDPISKLEYLYFLESTTHSSDRVPDHWAKSLDFRFVGDEPITGVRHEDAADFCNWLSIELESQDLYRLPTVRELSEGEWPNGFDRSPSWTYDRLGNISDDLASTVLGNSVLHEYVPFPNLPHLFLRNALRNYSISDSMKLLSRNDGPVEQEVMIELGNELYDQHKVSLLVNVSAETAEALYSPRPDDSIHCDGGQLEDKCIYLKNLLLQTTTIAMGDESFDTSPVSQAWAIDEGPAKLASKLSNDIPTLASLAFSRIRRRDSGSLFTMQEALKRLRFSLFLFTASLRTILTDMDASPDKPPKMPRRHLSLRAMKDRRLICVASLHILLKIARETYCSCVMLELRVSEEIPATETLRYVRVTGSGRTTTGTESATHALPRFQLAAKRSFDLTFAITAVLAMLPALVFIAVAIKATSRGPVFHLSERVGLDGRPFNMIKFRTMYRDADRMTLRPFDEDSHPLLFKMRDDPRVTPVGRIFRRYSVDELPQFFNVIKGDMSVVGPRPRIAREVATFDGKQRRQLKVKPGVTGVWQVSGRSDLSEASSMRLDLSYVENFSLGQDLRLIAQTFRAVARGEGKY